MLLQLKLVQLSANLPLEDSEIYFFLNEKNQQNSLPDGLNYEHSAEYVLMSEVTEPSISPTEFIIEVDNPEENKSFDLSTLAVSNSNSKIILLGSILIEIRKLVNSQFYNGETQTFTERLVGWGNQKGVVTFQVTKIESSFQLNYQNMKSSESLDREQTCSSDSYQANLKELNKTTDPDDSDDFSPKFKSSLENHFKNADYSQKIIVEEIDLQDDEDDEVLQLKKSNSSEDKKSFQFKLDETVGRKVNDSKDNLKTRFLDEKMKMASYLHNLQESDFYLMRMEERLRHLTE